MYVEPCICLNLIESVIQFDFCFSIRTLLLQITTKTIFFPFLDLFYVRLCVNNITAVIHTEIVLEFFHLYTYRMREAKKNRIHSCSYLRSVTFIIIRVHAKEGKKKKAIRRRTIVFQLRMDARSINFRSRDANCNDFVYCVNKTTMSMLYSYTLVAALFFFLRS